MNTLSIHKFHFCTTVFLLVFSLSTANSKEPPSVTESLLEELTRFQTMGEDRAIPVLLETCRPARMEYFYTRGKGKKMGRDIPINSLCRLLFQAKKGSSFRPPPYSAYYIGKQQGKHWPLNPYTIYKGLPIFIGEGGFYSGPPSSPHNYLYYCINSCEWSTFKYRTRTSTQIQKTLQQFISSNSWAKPLQPQQIETIVNQGAPITKQTQSPWKTPYAPPPAALTLELDDNSDADLLISIIIENPSPNEIAIPDISQSNFTGSIVIWFSDFEIIELRHSTQSINPSSETIKEKSTLAPGEQRKITLSLTDLHVTNSSVIWPDAALEQHFIVPEKMKSNLRAISRKKLNLLNYLNYYQNTIITPKPSAFQNELIYATWQNHISNRLLDPSGQ